MLLDAQAVNAGRIPQHNWFGENTAKFGVLWSVRIPAVDCSHIARLLFQRIMAAANCLDTLLPHHPAWNEIRIIGTTEN